LGGAFITRRDDEITTPYAPMDRGGMRNILSLSVVAIIVSFIFMVVWSNHGTSSQLWSSDQNVQVTGATNFKATNFWHALDSKNNIWTHARHPKPAGPLSGVNMAVGIGPAKTGSSALHKLLCGFKSVACGSRQLFGGKSPELDILHNDNLLHEGLSAYDIFFTSTNTSHVSLEPLLLYEKTPVYSASFHASFVAANILPENTKYIYTHRDFLTQDLSLYMHRKMYERNITYAKWVDDSLSIHKAWENCRRKLLDKVLLEELLVHVGDGDYIVDELLSNSTLFLPQESYWAEMQVSQSCGKPAPPFRPSDSFEELLHHRNINRWARYVGKDQILCVDHDTFKSKPCSVTKALTSFLKVERKTLQNIECNVELTERTNVKRVKEAMPDLQTESEITAASERLRDYVVGITKSEKKLVEVSFGSCKARFDELCM
jgi:hypothetical protein